MGKSAEKTALLDELARVGKALANGSRLELLDLLAQAERPVEALAAEAGLNLTTASAHLQTLKRAGLVSTRRDRTKIYYRLAGDDVAELLVLTRTVAANRLAGVTAARTDYFGPGQVDVIGREELLRRTRAGEVTLLDVRPAEEYAAGHLPGALNIPVAELAERLAELPAGADVVAYCRGPFCVFAHDAVRLLREHGLSASRLNEGVIEWQLAAR